MKTTTIIAPLRSSAAPRPRSRAMTFAYLARGLAVLLAMGLFGLVFVVAGIVSAPFRLTALVRRRFR